MNNRFIFPLSLSENMTKKYSSYTLEVSLMNDTKYWGRSGEEHGGRAVIAGGRPGLHRKTWGNLERMHVYNYRNVFWYYRTAGSMEGGYW